MRMTRFTGKSMAMMVLAASMIVPPVPPSARADRNVADDPEGLFFQEIPVAWVASKKKERVQDSPGMITSYTKDDINKLGYDTLWDLANITPGYGGYIQFGEKVFDTRGQKAGSYNNNKHLVLFDGMPINNARGNKAYASYQTPLYLAERVEFLRGPASALYGTSAFFGVVNIVPQKLETEGQAIQTKVAAGSDEGEHLVQTNVLNKRDGGEFYAYSSFYEKEASAKFVGTGNAATNSFRNRYWDDERSVFLAGSNKITNGLLDGLTLGFIYMQKNGGIGEGWMGAGKSVEENNTLWETKIPFLKYEKALSDKLTLNAYYKQQYDMEKGDHFFIPEILPPSQGGGRWPLIVYEGRIEKYEGQAELYYNPTDRTNIIVGAYSDLTQQTGGDRDYVSFVTVSTNPDSTFSRQFALQRKHNFKTLSAFSQVKHTFPVLAGLDAVAGVRYDKVTPIDQSFDQTSPRVGLVQRLNNAVNVKLLYGTALRSPGNKEVGLNQEKLPLLSSPSVLKPLKAETIESFEAGISVNTHRFSAAVAGFINETENSLDGTQIETQNVVQNSSGKVKSKGGEIEAKYAILRNLKLFANYSGARAYSYDQNGGSKTSEVDIPTYRANAGMMWDTKALDSTLMLRHVGQYTVPNGIKREGANKGHTVADLLLRKQLGDRGAVAGLQVRNIADVDYRLPDAGVDDIPMPGRTVLVSLDYKF
jgi:outer membrane receptor for ferrienterochelin and colicins